MNARLDQRRGRTHVHNLGAAGITDGAGAAHDQDRIGVGAERRIVDAAVIILGPVEDDRDALERVEVVNMRPPAALIQAGVHALPCIGDGRQSGTSGSPSILNAAPEAVIGGGLALVRTGDRIRIDLAKRTANMLVDDAELDRRRAELQAEPDYMPPAQTPWQEIHRALTGQFDSGAVLEMAVKYQRIAQTRGLPRDSH